MFMNISWLRAARMALMLAGGGIVVHGQPFSPYSQFLAMSVTEMSTLQMKLTYVGAAEGPVASLGITAPGNVFNLANFIPFRRPQIFYASDEIALNTLNASTTSLKNAITEVATLSNVTAGGVATAPYLSFAIWNSIGGVKAFEAVVNIEDAIALYQALRKAFMAEGPLLRSLNQQACYVAAHEPGVPVDVSSSTNVVLSGVRLNRATGRFVGTAQVRNISTSSISGPLSLVLGLQGRVRLFNAVGQTCATSPEGQDFINLQLTGSALRKFHHITGIWRWSSSAMVPFFRWMMPAQVL